MNCVLGILVLSICPHFLRCIFFIMGFYFKQEQWEMKDGVVTPKSPLSPLETVALLARATVTFLERTRPPEPLAGPQLSSAGPGCWLAHGGRCQSLLPV